MDAAQLIQWYLTLWLSLLGAALGSFFCCVADRYAAGERLPTGRSRCAGCGHSLGAAELIPVISYLWLRGRCRHCGAVIPVRCLVSELAGLVLFGALTLRYGPVPVLAMQLIFGSLLLLLALVDLATFTLPDGLLAAAVLNRLVFVVILSEHWWQVLPEMAFTAFGMGGALLGLSLLMDHCMKKETMGGGDIKLVFVLGLYFNWMEMLLLLFAACVLALGWLAGPGRAQAKQQIPFGPFLAGGWLLVVLFGSPLLNWYASLLG